MAVNEQEIRGLLDKPAAKSVSSDTINSNISRSTLLINNVKSSTATTNMIDEAVKALAVWMTYGTYIEGITRELGAAPEADQVKLGFFRRVAELYLAQISSQPVDLENPVENAKGSSLPLDPSVAGLMGTEAYP